ncbi:MAG: hypothetical protein KF834_09915 [Burkholderiales bacterium]|nr:hypothetical protein [Burkholderiales bacterium]
MKAWLAIFLAWMALQAAPAAAARSWHEMRAAQGQHERGDRGGQRQRGADRPERFERQERPQRLSDEERRGLHRDLDKARREIYRPRRER